MADLDPRDAVVTDEHLADVVDDTIQTLIEGAKFLVCCPTCGSDMPELMCGLCILTGHQEASDG